MSVTNLAVGQTIGLIATLNTKLEKPLLQSEMGLDLAATLLGQAVRFNEFSVKHTSTGAFIAGVITSADIADGTIVSADISATAGILGTQLATGTITQPKMKTKAVVALADAAATLTAAQMVDSTIFTITPTIARALTTDTAVAIIAAMPGYQVGTWFEVVIITLAAFAVTLTAGVGVTLVGSAVTNASSGTWLVRIDSSTTLTMYRE